MPGIFEDDTLYSTPVGGNLPDTALIAEPGPGIGLSPPSAAPAPVAAAPAADARPMGDRIAYALEAFGAGIKGQPSMYEREKKQAREDKLLKVQELKAHTDALEGGVKLLKGLTGDARKQVAQAYGERLNGISPDLGKAFQTLADQPDQTTAAILRYGDKSPTLRRALETGGMEAAAKLLASPEAIKTINAEVDAGVMPLLLRKGQTFLAGWQQLVPPDMAEKFNKDGTISASELMQANEWIKANKPDIAKTLALSDEEIGVIGRNEEAYYSSLGIVSPKTEQEILKKKGEKAIPDNKTEWIGVPGNKRQQAVIDKDGNVVRMIGSPIDAHAAPVNIYNGGLTAGVDSQGNPVFVQPSGREGVQPRVIENVRPPEAAAASKARRDADTAQNSFQSIDRQISELSALINTAEGKFTSATGIKGFATRAAEVAQGMVNPDAATPALDARNRKELLVAGLRKTMADSNMSTKDKEALEAAIGGIESAWGTKASTLRGLNNLRDFVRDRLPKQAAADKFSVGQVYTDANGNKAKYLGNGKWEDQ